MLGLLKRRREIPTEARAVQRVEDSEFNRFVNKVAEAFYLDDAGQDVTVEKALGVPAIWCAVNFLAGTMASLPMEVHRVRSDGSATRISSPITRLLNGAVNDEWTSYDWRKYVWQEYLTGGRGLTFIERAPTGRILNLWPLEPDRVKIEKRGGRTIYRYTLREEREVVYNASEVIDLPFMLKRDQISGHSPILANRKSIGLMIAATAYGARYFRGGGVPPFMISGNFQTGRSMKRASEDLERAVRKAADENRLAVVLPEGLDVKPVGGTPDKAQLLDLKRFSIEEAARIYQLPPVFLQDLTNGTYSNTEQQDLHFVKHTVRILVEQFERQATLKIFGRNSDRKIEVKLDSLLRGDFKARMEGHAQAIQNGVTTPNEAREIEGREPLPGGERLLIQGATVPLEGHDGPAASDESNAPPGPTEEGDSDDV